MIKHSSQTPNQATPFNPASPSLMNLPPPGRSDCPPTISEISDDTDKIKRKVKASYRLLLLTKLELYILSLTSRGQNMSSSDQFRKYLKTWERNHYTWSKAKGTNVIVLNRGFESAVAITSFVSSLRERQIRASQGHVAFILNRTSCCSQD